MTYDPRQHHRHSIRLPGFDYSRDGAYFITICAQRGESLFGSISNGTMHLNEWGRIIDQCWRGIPQHYPSARTDEYVVMPNHVHGILRLCSAPGDQQSKANLGRIIGSFKAAVSKQINALTGLPGAILWQPNYFEHVIRNDESLAAIREYISTNPSRWHKDEENSGGDGSDTLMGWLAQLDMSREKPKTAALQAPEPGGRARHASRLQSTAQDRARHASPLQSATQDRAGHAPPLPMRVGHGYDLHRLRPGGQLVLCGVVVSEDISPDAHSDGDVAIHALVDALLGAMGWGDIGEMFPNTDDRWQNAPSRVFLETVYGRVRQEGWSLVNADLTILAERPKLKLFKAQMTEFLQQILGGIVNIKAGTNENCDAIGRGEAIACHAVVLLSEA